MQGRVLGLDGGPAAGATVQLLPSDEERFASARDRVRCGADAKRLLEALELLPDTLPALAETRSGPDGTFVFDALPDAGPSPSLTATLGASSGSAGQVPVLAWREDLLPERKLSERGQPASTRRRPTRTEVSSSSSHPRTKSGSARPRVQTSSSRASTSPRVTPARSCSSSCRADRSS